MAKKVVEKKAESVVDRVNIHVPSELEKAVPSEGAKADQRHRFWHQDRGTSGAPNAPWPTIAPPGAYAGTNPIEKARQPLEDLARSLGDAGQTLSDVVEDAAAADFVEAQSEAPMAGPMMVPAAPISPEVPVQAQDEMLTHEDVEKEEMRLLEELEERIEKLEDLQQKEQVILEQTTVEGGEEDGIEPLQIDDEVEDEGEEKEAEVPMSDKGEVPLLDIDAVDEEVVDEVDNEELEVEDDDDEPKELEFVEEAQAEEDPELAALEKELADLDAELDGVDGAPAAGGAPAQPAQPAAPAEAPQAPKQTSVEMLDPRNKIRDLFEQTFDEGGPEGLMELCYSHEDEEVRDAVQKELMENSQRVIDSMVEALRSNDAALRAWSNYLSSQEEAEAKKLQGPMAPQAARKNYDPNAFLDTPEVRGFLKKFFQRFSETMRKPVAKRLAQKKWAVDQTQKNYWKKYFMEYGAEMVKDQALPGQKKTAQQDWEKPTPDEIVMAGSDHLCIITKNNDKFSWHVQFWTGSDQSGMADEVEEGEASSLEDAKHQCMMALAQLNEKHAKQAQDQDDKEAQKGWDDSSRKKFWDSITGDRVHKRTKCMEQMKGKVDDPGAFCNSLYQKFEASKEAQVNEDVIQVNEDVIQEAALLGEEAFAQGKKRVPAQDAALMALIEANSSGIGSSIPLMDAWTAAWDKANLAAPVEAKLAQIEEWEFSSEVFTFEKNLETGKIMMCNSDGGIIGEFASVQEGKDFVQEYVNFKPEGQQFAAEVTKVEDNMWHWEITSGGAEVESGMAESEEAANLAAQEAKARAEEFMQTGQMDDSEDKRKQAQGWAPSAEDLFDYAMNVSELESLLQSEEVPEDVAAAYVVSHYNEANEGNPERLFNGDQQDLADAIMQHRMGDVEAKQAQQDWRQGDDGDWLLEGLGAGVQIEESQDVGEGHDQKFCIILWTNDGDDLTYNYASTLNQAKAIGESVLEGYLGKIPDLKREGQQSKEKQDLKEQIQEKKQELQEKKQEKSSPVQDMIKDVEKQKPELINPEQQKSEGPTGYPQWLREMPEKNRQQYFAEHPHSKYKKGGAKNAAWKKLEVSSRGPAEGYGDFVQVYLEEGGSTPEVRGEILEVSEGERDEFSWYILEENVSVAAGSAESLAAAKSACDEAARQMFGVVTANQKKGQDWMQRVAVIEFKGHYYEIWYSVHRGYMTKGLGEAANQIGPGWNETQEEAQEHAEMELSGWMEDPLMKSSKLARRIAKLAQENTLTAEEKEALDTLMAQIESLPAGSPEAEDLHAEIDMIIDRAMQRVGEVK